MIGQSDEFKAALHLVEKIARNDAPVLIEGETGTGKELVARALHYGGARRDHPFIPLNCGALPDTLMENELFGHRKGAYTDAKSEQAGVIAHADHGTLFLDEIDALTPRAQIVFLRFLQDQQYRPLGSGEARSADVRIVAASNADLDVLTRRGDFRLDLLYRLKVMHIVLPPLRERCGDTALLAEHFLARCAARFKSGEKRLTPDSLQRMEGYDWPGNVRELENFIYREYLLSDDGVIDVAMPGLCRQPAALPRPDLAQISFKQAKNRAIAEFERQYVADILSATAGNVTKAASLVGKERRAFGRLLKKHDIDKSPYAR
jgi:two-component system response regulator GlrR